METMRAMVLVGHGDLDKLHYKTDWAKPAPRRGQVLVRVQACGLNNTDINTRTAWYSKGTAGATTGAALEGINDDDAAWGGAPIQFPRIQGADVAGVVEAVGDAGDESIINRRVLIDTWLRDWADPYNKNKAGYFGSECDGGYAEWTVVDARQVHPINTSLSDIELATFATSYSTAEGMLRRAEVKDCDTVLITGASGGVGSALIQLAKRRGARVIAVCGKDKMAAVQSVGADIVLSRAEDLHITLKTAGVDNVSVVADVVGGPQWTQLIDSLSRGGRYVTSGAIGGAMVALDLRTLYLNDLTLLGSTVLPPGVFADLVGYIERGEIRPLVAAQYPLEKLHDAQRAFIAKKHVGNIVVTCD